ncbi:MAG: carbohydrate binding family 9 domain-containing protein [Cyclobacteriaceae bacterium]
MKFPLSLLLLVAVFFLFGQARQYETSLTNSPPKIDGILDDETWGQVEWTGDFVQYMPDYGKAPAQPTRFKILYDAKYLYIGIQAFDNEPDKIVKRMSRRDGFEGDWVEVNIDSYHDKRTAFSFTASVSGVKGDEYISNNGDNWDETWDPIWYVATSIDDEGWNAEYKIPLSQLRFADKPDHTWGMQVTRRFFRDEQRSVWQPIPNDAPGWVHLFGELKGLKGIKPQKQLEIMPYIVGKTERYEAEENNPYRTGVNNEFDVGVDAKIGITSDITLDLTINPDFGQVEADPSQVNLSAFRLFFQERRPFFLEGNNVLNFEMGDSDNLFYSRRIGRNPSYYPYGENIQFVDQPSNTRILGAAKLTGKNAKGFSWGLLESITNQEMATVTTVDGEEQEIVVEPYTNYTIGRFQQDIKEGETVIGAMLTSTNRFIDDDHLNFLHANAYSGGFDITHNFNDRKYFVQTKGAFSNVNGSEEALLQTQTASERFFQRPNNYHHDVDSTLKSLTGTSAGFVFGKQSGKIRFRSILGYKSPGLELNDVGFLVQTDAIEQDNWIQYRTLETVGNFRFFRFNVNQGAKWDFDGVNTQLFGNVNVHGQFKNYWMVGTGINARDRIVSNADLRGGPSFIFPGGSSIWAFVGSPDQKQISIGLETWYYQATQDAGEEFGLWMNIRWQPFDAMSIVLQPSINKERNELQYISTESDGGSNRYILGTIRQSTYRMSIRTTYNLTPNLSLEYWGQPFISSGEYSNLKVVTNPIAHEYGNRYLDLSGSSTFIANDGVYSIDENSDGAEDYQVGDPDFNVMQFRSNFVMRWEYIPGSTLFAVWAVNGSNFNNSDDNSFRHLSKDLLEINSGNTFLIKYTYRFVL